MKREMTLFLLLGLLIAQPACTASPLFYSAEAIEARVVDAETKKPIEGVVVTANWQLYHSTVGGRVPGSQLMVMEAVTNKDGKFAFTAWGPKLALRGYLDERDPQLLLFKPGYEYKRLMNQVSSKTNMASLRRSEWNGRTIELKPFNGTDEEYAKHVHGLDRNLEFARYGLMGTLEDCEWKKVPKMLAALHRVSEYFDSKQVKLPGWRGGARIRKVTDVGNQNKCGPAADFFGSYLP